MLVALDEGEHVEDAEGVVEGTACVLIASFDGDIELFKSFETWGRLADVHFHILNNLCNGRK